MATTHDEGRAKVRHGADLLASRDREENATSRLDPGRDASRENVARAQRQGWTRSGGPSHRSDRSTS
jgi:hypothetical protein